MKINSYDGLLGRVNAPKSAVGTNKGNLAGIETQSNPGGGSRLSVEDTVDISSLSSLQRMSVAAEGLMSEFKVALVNSMPGYQSGSSMSQLNNLSGTPLDKFIKTRFADTSAETKKEFMNYFEGLSRISGGFASSNMISQAFGRSNGFASMISNISQNLSKYL